MMVRCFTVSGLRVANLLNCTSGMPVKVANTPRAVPKEGEKQRSKKIPSLHNCLK